MLMVENECCDSILLKGNQEVRQNSSPASRALRVAAKLRILTLYTKRLTKYLGNKQPAIQSVSIKPKLQMTKPPGSGYDAEVLQEPLKTCYIHLRTCYTTLALKYAVDP